MEPVKEPVQVAVDVVKLFVMKELKRDLQVASLEVLPHPKDGPIADKRHIRFDPVS